MLREDMSWHKGVLSMGNYVLKLNGEKIRSFTNPVVANAWAKKHCHSGNVEIVSLVDCGRLPRASSRIYPNESMPDLVYKPFVSVEL